ncbi:tRNA-dihydrouridine(20) synthase [NAD(P)+]-like isoform X2 [Amyelois transitella]|uniref:tRNA-dihydrouridine(20) synthase [NAD(P)+]-like isoform X2 n=1 Tax=Amyelois transitella TaxID=680683 RepID=UPI00067CD7A1|nr:tRNA-dihydrouridine(20) synthase [NAD(P)+]-like isoform X2 [Amyelois transitella]
MLDYKDKVILAPMVRIGTLPMRLLALRYGADIVYTEELIDWKFLRSRRRYNEILNTVDYVDQTDGTIVFRTCSEEKEKVVLQLGTCDATRALKVGKLVENDVAAIDINMGCPKEFSIKGGMGVALMAQPDKAYDILKTLVSNLSIPISCKIRIFEKAEDTLKLVDTLVSAGIKAIAIHGRTRDERPQHAVHPDIIHYVAERTSIPVIANGGSKDIEKHNDIEKFKDVTGCSSVMIARAAEWNCSIFRKEGLLPMDDVIREYLKLAVDYDNSPSNTKYCVQNILRDLQETPRGRQFLDCQTLEQICYIWDLGEYCKEKQSQYHKMGIQGRWQVSPNELEPPQKKFKSVDNLENVTQMKVCFIRANFNDLNLPKSRLHAWAGKNGLKLPVYETQQIEKLFRTVITFDGQKFTSSFWEKNKKFAEQGAALVCLHKLGLVSEEDLIKLGSVIK